MQVRFSNSPYLKSTFHQVLFQIPFHLSIFSIMTNQLNIFLLLFGAVQGALVSFALLKNVRKERSQLFLILFLTVVGLQLTFKVVSKIWLWENARGIYLLSYSLPYLSAPLLYWFVTTRLTKQKFLLKHWLHFVPFAISFLSILSADVIHINIGSILSWLLRDYVACVIQLANLSMFGWLAYRATQSSTSPIRSGLKQFTLLASGCEAVIIIAIALLHHYYGLIPDLRLLFLVLTLMIYWISYKLVSQPEIFITNGVVPILQTHDMQRAEMKLEPSPTKYSHSGLKSEEADRIAALLSEAMGKDKLFLNANLTIDTLAAAVKVSRHHLSQVLNERFQKNYFDFLTSYRLEESRARLANNKYNHFTIAAIALDSGFSSVSSFNEAFKNQYNTTPSKFRLEARKQMSA
jgi:AraC-like DNA-binding protein